MSRGAPSLLAWKWLVGTLALAALLLLCVELGNAFGPLSTGRQGGIGIEFEDQPGITPAAQGTQRLRVLSVAPGSAAQAAGVRPGARVSFARPIDRWRKFAVGEPVDLVVHEAGASHALRLAAYPVPVSFADRVDWIGRFLLSFPALLFGLMIGFKQAGERSGRALSLGFLALSLDAYYTFNYSPAGFTFTLSKLASLGTYVLIWYLLARFSLAWQPYPRSRVRSLLLRAFPVYRMLACGAAAGALWFGLGHEAPGLWHLAFGGVMGGLVLSVASLAEGLHRTRGEVRQRHLWLLLSFAAGALPSALTWITPLDLTYRGVRLTIMASFAGQLLMYIGLAYAVLRHRVFNFSFAISRALIFSVVSVLLLCVFGLMQWMFAPMLDGNAHGAERRGLAEAAIALLVYLGFHHVHQRVARTVERILFQQWHESERVLRDFVRRAAHITTVDALLGALVAALDRFTQHAGAAVYLARPGGGYALITSTLAHAAPALALDDGLSKVLSDSKVPVRCGQLAGIAIGELALPMSHRGALHGLVIIGSKALAEPYRPDECGVLGFAVRQIGLDLDALNVELLESRLQELTLEAERQEARLRLLAGRRGSERSLAARAEGAPA